MGVVAGRVGLYEPAAGTYLARGMTVRVTGAGGGEQAGNLMMPSLVGLSVDQANATMDSLEHDRCSPIQLWTWQCGK
jgi:beta-lactam-binding protein with PASTA domain